CCASAPPCWERSSSVSSCSSSSCDRPPVVATRTACTAHLARSARLETMSTTDPHRYTWPEDTVVEPDGTIVFRPSWENYRAKFLRVPAFLMAIVALNLFRMDDLRLALALLVVSLAGAAAGTALYFRRALTSVGPRGLVRRDLIRNTAVPKERLGEVIFVRELAHYDPRIDTTLIVTDAQGRKVAMFNGPFWSADQLYAMASALQQPTWQP